MAAQVAFVTLMRARSDAEEALRARPPSPVALASSWIKKSRSTCSRTARSESFHESASAISASISASRCRYSSRAA